jgi:hypothetical protein
LGDVYEVPSLNNAAVVSDRELLKRTSDPDGHFGTLGEPAPPFLEQGVNVCSRLFTPHSCDFAWNQSLGSSLCDCGPRYSTITTPPVVPVKAVEAAVLIYELPTRLRVSDTMVVWLALRALPPVNVSAAFGKYSTPVSD